MTPALKESRSGLRTRSAGNLFHRTTVMGKKSIDSNIQNIKSEMRSFKSNENIHKKEGASYYVVSANKASSVTL